MYSLCASHRGGDSDAVTDIDTVRAQCCASARLFEIRNALRVGYACSVIGRLRYTSSSLMDVLEYCRFLSQRGCIEMLTRGA